MLIRKRIWAIIILIGILWFPFELKIASERQFQILDLKGNPINGAMVRQHWDQYALQFHKSVDSQSNPEGKISFPERTVRTSVLFLIYGGARELISAGRSAGFWSYESIGVAADGFENKWIYDGKGLESGVIVLKKK